METGNEAVNCDVYDLGIMQCQYNNYKYTLITHPRFSSVAVVRTDFLFATDQTYMHMHACTSTCLELCGCRVSSLTHSQLMKFSKLRDFPLLETSMFFIMSYSTYLLAEFAQLTGQLTPRKTSRPRIQEGGEAWLNETLVVVHRVLCVALVGHCTHYCDKIPPYSLLPALFRGGGEGLG